MSAILNCLRKQYTVKIFEKENPFEMLVRTILSQNTNDTNSDRAFFRLKGTFNELTPKKLANAELQQIENAIRIAGLYKIKAPRIFEVSRYIMENFEGSIEKILRLPFKEVRKELIQLKGIGFKTADIMLLFYCNHLVIPVDTHITRVTKRLGFVEQNAKYEKIRENLEILIFKDHSVYKETHLLLIELGRSSCRAINPKCNECVVESLCPKLIVKKSKKRPKKTSKKSQRRSGKN